MLHRPETNLSSPRGAGGLELGRKWATTAAYMAVGGKVTGVMYAREIVKSVPGVPFFYGRRDAEILFFFCRKTFIFCGGEKSFGNELFFKNYFLETNNYGLEYLIRPNV